VRNRDGRARSIDAQDEARGGVMGGAGREREGYIDHENTKGTKTVFFVRLRVLRAFVVKAAHGQSARPSAFFSAAVIVPPAATISALRSTSICGTVTNFTTEDAVSLILSLVIRKVN